MVLENDDEMFSFVDVKKLLKAKLANATDTNKKNKLKKDPMCEADSFLRNFKVIGVDKKSRYLNIFNLRKQQ